MKTVRRNLLVAVAFVLTSLTNYANVETISKNTKAVKVVFENVEKGHSLTITDEEGIVLHRENVSKDGELVKFFDLSSLKDGNYKIEVDKNFETLVKNFKIKNKEVIISESFDKVVFKPVVKNKNNSILISKINFDKTPVNVTIYYNNVMISDETLKSNETLLNKVYKLDETKKGNYTVVVFNNNKSVIKEFSL